MDGTAACDSTNENIIAFMTMAQRLLTVGLLTPPAISKPARSAGCWLRLGASTTTQENIEKPPIYAFVHLGSRLVRKIRENDNDIANES
jgi:hypothetical protein